VGSGGGLGTKTFVHSTPYTDIRAHEYLICAKCLLGRGEAPGKQFVFALLMTALLGGWLTLPALLVCLWAYSQDRVSLGWVLVPGAHLVLFPPLFLLYEHRKRRGFVLRVQEDPLTEAERWNAAHGMAMEEVKEERGKRVVFSYDENQRMSFSYDENQRMSP
jgi:hypothetical protein